MSMLFEDKISEEKYVSSSIGGEKVVIKGIIQGKVKVIKIYNGNYLLEHTRRI